jgi:hypothetical protein
MMDVINRTDLQSFLFFYSVWMVDNLTLTYDEGFNNFTLFVQIHEPSGNACQHCDLAFQNHPGPALYQINRLAISMHSLFINDVSFLSRVTVQLSQPVPGIGGSTFLLKDFTQKEVFNVSGPTGAYICEDCPYYLPLTNSPESCVALNGSIVPCVDITHLGSPYSDLSFETSLAPKVTCTSEPPPTRWWWWVVWLVVAAVPTITIIIIASVVIYKKHKKGKGGYHEINGN